jgi:hypothetical protein
MKKTTSPAAALAALSNASQKAKYGEGYAAEMRRRAALATEARKAKREARKLSTSTP